MQAFTERTLLRQIAFSLAMYERYLLYLTDIVNIYQRLSDMLVCHNL